MIEKKFPKEKCSPTKQHCDVGDEDRPPLLCTKAAFLPFRVTQAPPDPLALLAKMAPRVFVVMLAPLAVLETPASKAPPAPLARRANLARTAPR